MIDSAMDLSAPPSVLLAPGERAALSVLARTTRALSGREIARMGGGAVSTVWRALQRLVDHGVVHTEEAGGALLYTLNREHVATEAILILIGLRHRFLERLETDVDAWGIRPIHVSVFGSAARGDGDTESDIDLFVVRPAGVAEESRAWRRQLEALSEHVLAWTGNHAGIAEVPEEDVERLSRERPPVVAEMERDALTVVGPSIRNLFSGQRA